MWCFFPLCISLIEIHVICSCVRLLLQIHDELVWEMPSDQLQETCGEDILIFAGYVKMIMK